MKLSVITVCYQAADILADTLESVWEQTCQEFEYIYVDGGSTDGTLELIAASLGDRARGVSEPDQGIYDAMNKGVRLCRGEYVIFLNAGDTFASKETVAQIVYALLEVKADIVYGDYVDCFPAEEKHVRYKGNEIRASFFLSSRMICHQAIVAGADWLRKHPFQTEYRYCADREWLIWCYRHGAKIRHIRVEIARYDRNGVSSGEQALEAVRGEVDRCLRLHFPVRAGALMMLKRNRRVRNWIRRKIFYRGNR